MRVTEFLILAFSSYSFIAHLIGRLGWIFLCGYLATRFFRGRNRVLALLTIVSGVIGFRAAESLDLRNALRALYAAEIDLVSDYDQRCKPPEGADADGTVLRLCDRQDWDAGERTVAVLYVQGDPSGLMTHRLDSPSVGRASSLRSLSLPFGIAKYEATHICDQYYMVLFENEPVGRPAKPFQ
jgi:hypothetical protein